jgi:hypothetical protein
MSGLEAIKDALLKRVEESSVPQIFDALDFQEALVALERDGLITREGAGWISTGEDCGDGCLTDAERNPGINER